MDSLVEKVGKNVFVRTDTDHWTGRLVRVDGPYTVTIVDVAWIANSGYFSDFFLYGENTERCEIEPVPDGIEFTVNHRGVFDWPHPLCRTVRGR